MIRTTALAVLLAVSFPTVATEQARDKPDLAKAKEIAGGVCVACHGADGNSPAAANPILAGQIPQYIYKQLSNFKAVDGKPAVRNNAIMGGMVAALSDEDMRSLSVYFSQQKMQPSVAKDEKLLADGKTLWRKGDFEKGIPACAGCHGPAGAGSASTVSEAGRTVRRVHVHSVEELPESGAGQRRREGDACDCRQALRSADQRCFRVRCRSALGAGGPRSHGWKARGRRVVDILPPWQGPPDALVWYDFLTRKDAS
jgi:cytochrome c553